MKKVHVNQVVKCDGTKYYNVVITIPEYHDATVLMEIVSAVLTQDELLGFVTRRFPSALVNITKRDGSLGSVEDSYHKIMGLPAFEARIVEAKKRLVTSILSDMAEESKSRLESYSEEIKDKYGM